MKRAIIMVMLTAVLQNANAGVDPEVDLRKAELAVEDLTLPRPAISAIFR